MSPALAHCSNSARVGAGSVPVNPPIAMTALPPLASSRLAALFEPSTAAAQRVVVFSSAWSSADERPAPPGPPPPKPPREDPDGRLPRSVPYPPPSPRPTPPVPVPTPALPPPDTAVGIGPE